MKAPRFVRWIGTVIFCAMMTILLSSQMAQVGHTALPETTDTASRGDRIAQTVAPGMQRESIEKLAAYTTVVIAQDLEPGQVEAGQAIDPGSGVIVAKAGNLYFAVTNLHVVPYVNVTYGVRTYDGRIYTATQRRDDFFGIFRLGEQLDDRVRGLDIAVVVFKSDRNYPVAGVNLTDRPTRGDNAFVSGWPMMPEGKAMERRFSPGQIANVAAPSPDGGYGLFYTSATSVGMSGGPVFNYRGEVIGIHGRGSTAATRGANQGIQATSVATRAVEFKRTSPLLNRLNFVTRSPEASAIASWPSIPASANVFDNPREAFREQFRQAALGYCSSSRVLTGDPQDDCTPRSR